MTIFNVVTTPTYHQTGIKNGWFLLVVNEEGHISNFPGIKKVKGLGVFYNTNKFLGPNRMLYYANWQRDKFTPDQIAEVRRIVARAKVTSPKSAPFKLIASGKLGGPFRYDSTEQLNNKFATLEAVVKKLKPATQTTDEKVGDRMMTTVDATDAAAAAAPAPVAAAAPAPTKSRMLSYYTSDEEEEDESKDSTITESRMWADYMSDEEEEEEEKEEKEEATAIVDAPTPFAKTSWANIVAAALATEEVADAAKAVAKQVKSDAKMAKEMQEEDESKSGGGGAATAVGDTTLPEPATTSAWGTRRTDMSTNDSADILARMEASAKVNRATQSAKVNRATQSAKKAAFPTCHTCGLRASTYNGVSNKFCSDCYKASKQTCQDCDSCVYIHDGVPNRRCSACYEASRKTCTGCHAKVSMNPYTHEYNQLCSACYEASIRPSSVAPKGKSFDKKGNNARVMTLTDRKKH